MASAPIHSDDPPPSKARGAAYAVSLFATLGVIGAGSYVAWLPHPRGDAAPEMIRVRGGPLTVQTGNGNRTIRIRTLEVDPTEVTVAAYRKCVDAGACKPPAYVDEAVPGAGVNLGEALGCTYDQPGRAAHPVSCVSVAEAIAYCEWRGARLPTTNEWRYLARGSAPREFPWGDEPPDSTRLHVRAAAPGNEERRPAESSPPATSPAGAYPAGRTPEGLFDMAGNVAEWACNLEPEQEELDDVACWTFTELGGSFAGSAEAGDRETTTGRYWRDGYRSPTIGFRCVR